MFKYRDHWETARNSIEEWRLARAEYRDALARGVQLPEVDDDDADNASEIKDRFRRVHAAKRPVELHTIVWVHQRALEFGAHANPPRVRRPVLVLRSDPWLKEILAAPMSTLNIQNPRRLPIRHDEEGLIWSRTANRRDAFLYDTPEKVNWVDVRRKDRDSPLATVVEPLLRTALAHVFIHAHTTVH